MQFYYSAPHFRPLPQQFYRLPFLHLPPISITNLRRLGRTDFSISEKKTTIFIDLVTQSGARHVSKKKRVYKHK